MEDKKKDLKIRALLEKISNLTTNYENQIADLRVELTLTTEQLEEAYKELQQLREQNEDNEITANERATAPE